MKQETADHMKRVVILEKIGEALKKNQFESQESVIKAEAEKFGFTETEFKQMLEEAKAGNAKVTKATSMAAKHKYLIWAIAAILIVLEWVFIFNAHPAEGQSRHIILTLVINVVTLIVVAIGAAAVINKKMNK